MPSSNSWALNMSNELTTIFTIAKTYYFHLSIHVCKLFLYHVFITWGWGVITIFCKLEPWLEDKAMIFKWQNPSTWVRNDKKVSRRCSHL
jgi:hypothetical protein